MGSVDINGPGGEGQIRFASRGRICDNAQQQHVGTSADGGLRNIDYNVEKGLMAAISCEVTVGRGTVESVSKSYCADDRQPKRERTTVSSRIHSFTPRASMFSQFPRGVSGLRPAATVVLLLIGLARTDVAVSAQVAPDLLGLQRLERMWQTDTNDDTSLPFITEERFIMEQAAEEGTGVPTSEDETRRSMVTWLNEYAKNQVLFRSEDLAKLREALQSVPDEQFSRWMADSQELRERLTGDSWQHTQRWLRAFLDAQAIYSDSELEALRVRLAEQTPSRLMRVLDHFQTAHLSRMRSAQAADQFRQQRLLSVGSMRPSPRTALPASFSSGNAFPSAAAPVNPSARYLVRRPSLSQRISNYYIYSGVFGNRDRFIWWLW